MGNEKEQIEYGIYIKKNDKYVLIRDGFSSKAFATKRAEALERMFYQKNGYLVKTYVLLKKRRG